MRVKFLGTAAAEGWPALFCQCEVCEKARKLGGKNIRTRSSCLIDDEYMVDFPPDTYLHKLNYDLDLSKVKHIFITHSHSDHYYPSDFEMRCDGFAHIYDKNPLIVHGNEKVMKGFNDVLASIPDFESRVVFHLLRPYDYYDAGRARIMSLLADHDKMENCFIYIIEIDGKVLLYGHDSGYYSEQTWEEILKHKFDGVILDCTMGNSKEHRGHMGIIANGEIKERMLRNNAADSNTKFIITHFSHNNGLLHEDIEKMAEPYGFIVTYDGFEIEI